MLFNSIPFAIFLPFVFIIYWMLSRWKLGIQNGFLLIASYIFYGWWDWRFLSLIFASSLIDYVIGLNLDRTEDTGKKRLLLCISLTTNLGLLATFKYFNFFINSFSQLSTHLGFETHLATLNIILPVGISFYTFQTLSYTIDIYLGRISATKNPISFFAFVSFFPQLVAGPIERAKALLPQFERIRTFDVRAAKDGLRQIFWGYLKKMVVADNLAPHVEQIFARHGSLDSPTLILGAFFLPCKSTVTSQGIQI